MSCQDRKQTFTITIINKLKQKRDNKSKPRSIIIMIMTNNNSIITRSSSKNTTVTNTTLSNSKKLLLFLVTEGMTESDPLTPSPPLMKHLSPSLSLKPFPKPIHLPLSNPFPKHKNQLKKKIFFFLHIFYIFPQPNKNTVNR